MKKYFKKSWYKGKYSIISISIRGFRPGSSPYFSGDTLRKYAHFIFDELNHLSHQKLKKMMLFLLKQTY